MGIVGSGILPSLTVSCLQAVMGACKEGWDLCTEASWLDAICSTGCLQSTHLNPVMLVQYTTGTFFYLKNKTSRILSELLNTCIHPNFTQSTVHCAMDPTEEIEKNRLVSNLSHQQGYYVS